MAARYVNIVVGAWLFISAFIWQHSNVSRTNTWIVGALAVIFAVIALRTPVVRFLNTALAVWLFFSTLAFFHVSGGTLWNNLIVAAIMFIASLIPSSAVSSGQRPRRFVQA
jgi:SPW repeat-containing protein